MPRPKEFARDAVLDRAVGVFWTRGYEATSIQDLVDAMGIQRGSLYNEFGDKRALFLAVLERYEREQLSRIREALRAPGAVRERIRRAFSAVIGPEPEGAPGRGCLALNTVTELGGADPALAARASATLRRVEAAFRDALQGAQQRGEIDPAADALALARFLTCSLQGIRVMSRAGARPRELADVVEVALGALA